MPNTQEALSKIIEHFSMLLTYISVDLCEHNERKVVYEQDVLLALKEVGMEALIEPLQQSLHSFRPRKEKKPRTFSSKVGIQMADLLRKKLIQPGKKKLTETYMGKTMYADLREDGVIICDGQEFVTPSSFSIYVKKSVGTHQDSSNGWQSVRYVEAENNLVKLIYYKKLAIASNKVSISLNVGGSTGTASEGSNADVKSEEAGDKMEVDDDEKAVEEEPKKQEDLNKRTAAGDVAAPPPSKKAKVSTEE
jgi:hypothetical protein